MTPAGGHVSLGNHGDGGAATSPASASPEIARESQLSAADGSGHGSGPDEGVDNNGQQNLGARGGGGGARTAATRVQGVVASAGSYGGGNGMFGGGDGGGGASVSGRAAPSTGKGKLVGGTGVEDEEDEEEAEDHQHNHDNDVLHGGGSERGHGGGGGGSGGPKAGATGVRRVSSAGNGGRAGAGSNRPRHEKEGSGTVKKARPASAGAGARSRQGGPLSHQLHMRGGHRGVLLLRGEVTMRGMADTKCTCCGKRDVKVIFDCAMEEPVERNLWCFRCLKKKIQLEQSATADGKMWKVRSGW